VSGLVTVLGAAALALVAPGAVYLAALTAAAASPTRREGDQARRGQPGDGGGGAPVRVVIVVPAHDESKGILRTLRRLQAEVVDDAQARIVVVADNCSDDTAAVALSAGVDVLERTDPAHRGKGPALAFGFAACRDADWLVVVDADTDVEPGFLATMRRAMVAGADALQCRYVVRDAAGSHRAALADVAAGAWNVVRPRGRAAVVPAGGGAGPTRRARGERAGGGGPGVGAREGHFGGLPVPDGRSAGRSTGTSLAPSPCGTIGVFERMRST